MSSFQPAYISTYEKGELKDKIRKAYALLLCCTICPRECEVDRSSPERGICATGDRAFVSSFDAHFGEESPLVGRHGSGTIFFTHCNLKCIFCQNYDISHLGRGAEVSDKELAQMMLRLQDMGCHNINFVSPSHVVPQILSALDIAIEQGLSVPLVYNTGAYDKVETLHLLEGIFDIYMPDFKFWNPEIARVACKAEDYPEVAQKALLEMHRQVGDLTIDETGVATRGLLIRHLVLPGGLANTRDIARFIVNEISSNSYVNIMSQYRPCFKADKVAELAKPLSAQEYELAVQVAREEGLNRLDSRKRFFMLY